MAEPLDPADELIASLGISLSHIGDDDAAHHDSDLDALDFETPAVEPPKNPLAGCKGKIDVCDDCGWLTVRELGEKQVRHVMRHPALPANDTPCTPVDRSHLGKIAQDGGGGDGGGGGAAAGGDGGGAAAPSGGDAAPSGADSGTIGHTCPDGAYTHVNNYTGWGCLGCGRCGWGWGYPYGRHPVGPHKHKKKKRKKPESDYESYRDREDARTSKVSAEEDEGSCAYGDNAEAVTDFLGKKVCPDHLKYALEDAPNALAKAQEGVNTATSVDRLKYETAVQKIKQDIDRGTKTLSELERKKDLSQSGVNVASTQENVMECDKCGVQATHESVTTAGRGLLCAEHAQSFVLSREAAGIVAKVFPLHKEASFTKEAPGGGIHAPYNVEKRGDGYVVVNSEGEVKGHHKTKAEARDQQEALYANVEGASEMAERKHKDKKGSIPQWIKEAQQIDLTGETLCECGHPTTGKYGHAENGDCVASNCPCQVSREKAASKEAQVDDVDRLCDECHGQGCAGCANTGLSMEPNDEERRQDMHGRPLNDSTRAFDTDLDAPFRTNSHIFMGQALDEPEEPKKEDASDHATIHDSNELEQAAGEGGHSNKPEGVPDWMSVHTCSGCGETKAQCDVCEQEVKVPDDYYGGGAPPPPPDRPAPKGMADLPDGDALKDLESRGLKYHQTVREPGAETTQDRRFIHDTREEAESSHARALDAGLESELRPIQRNSSYHCASCTAQTRNLNDEPREPITQLKGDCVRCGKQVFAGDSSDFGGDTWSCTNCAPLVAQNLDTYKSAHKDEILADLYENDPAEWARVAQNLGCPNCSGLGSTADGKVCPACFGTGHGGGLMLKGGQVEAPAEAEFGILFADDGQMYRTENGTEWTLVEAAADHTEAQEEEDDDVKLKRFDHGPGQGNDTAHSEIHQQEHIAGWAEVRTVKQAGTMEDAMTGRGCARCGNPEHVSERCPLNRGHSAPGAGSDGRYVDYSDYQPKAGSVDDELMTDIYDLSDEDLALDPFEAKPKPKKKAPKKEEDSVDKAKKKVKEVGDKVIEVADKAEDAASFFTESPKKKGQVNPAASEGTTVFDLADNVGNGEHPVPPTIITDHYGEVSPGVEPATCRVCGGQMSSHAQINPTKQVGVATGSVEEEIGWMDVPSPDLRPKRGSFEKEAHSPTYDVSLHDPQQPGAGDQCQYCGQQSNYALGAVKAFTDPINPVTGRIVAHQQHFEEYRASVPAATAAPVPTVVPAGEGKGVVINVYAKTDPANELP